MSTHWLRIILLVAVSICLACLSLIEPKVHADTGIMILGPGEEVRVAQYELQAGEIVEYSFEASDTVGYSVTAYGVFEDLYSAPLIVLLTTTSASGGDTFTAQFHGVYRFDFANPSGASNVELSYMTSHHLQWPTTLALSLMLLAGLTSALALRHLVLFRRWQKDGYPPGRDGESLRERRRLASVFVWSRH
jgi:hypothetical protein